MPIVHITCVTFLEFNEVIQYLRDNNYWETAVASYGYYQCFFQPHTIRECEDFLEEHRVWSYDYEPHYNLSITFSEESNAVLFKLKYI